jgi:hypothetical protein
LLQYLACEAMKSTIAWRVSSRSSREDIDANDSSTVSPRNCPFSRVGVSRNVSCADCSAERCINENTASSVGLSLWKLAACPAGASVFCTTAEMSAGLTGSPGSLISR